MKEDIYWTLPAPFIRFSENLLNDPRRCVYVYYSISANTICIEISDVYKKREKSFIKIVTESSQHQLLHPWGLQATKILSSNDAVHRFAHCFDKKFMYLITLNKDISRKQQ